MTWLKCTTCKNAFLKCTWRLCQKLITIHHIMRKLRINGHLILRATKLHNEKYWQLPSAKRKHWQCGLWKKVGLTRFVPAAHPPNLQTVTERGCVIDYLTSLQPWGLWRSTGQLYNWCMSDAAFSHCFPIYHFIIRKNVKRIENLS